MLSGMIDAYDPRHLTRLESEIQQEGGTTGTWDSLNVYGNGSGIELSGNLTISNSIVRENIAKTLGRVGHVDQRIRESLQTACSDEDSEVARAAVESLKLLAGREG